MRSFPGLNQVGPPRMEAGSLREAMRSEHTAQPDRSGLPPARQPTTAEPHPVVNHAIRSHAQECPTPHPYHAIHGFRDIPFATTNGFAGITSAQEWEFVTSPHNGTAYPERAGFAEEHREWCRQPLPLRDFEAKMQTLNAQLSERGHTQMVIEARRRGSSPPTPCKAHGC